MEAVAIFDDFELCIGEAWMAQAESWVSGGVGGRLATFDVHCLCKVGFTSGEGGRGYNDQVGVWEVGTNQNHDCVQEP